MKKSEVLTITPTGGEFFQEFPNTTRDDNEGAGVLSAAKLREITGFDDLREVTYLELQLDSDEVSLSTLGELLPNLVELRLSDSKIGSLRELGHCMNKLRILWLARCGLADLDGVEAFPTLQELYAPFNNISEVMPLSTHPNLQTLDLDENQISDVSSIEFLAQIKKLQVLHLQGNPVSDLLHYHNAVCSRISQLQFLDDIKVQDGMRRKVPASQENIIGQKSATRCRALTRPSHETLKKAFGDDRRNSLQRPMSSHRPQTGSRTGATNAIDVLNCQLIRPHTARPATALLNPPLPAAKKPTGDASSDLTFGTGEALYGNIMRGLRRRRNNGGSTSASSSGGSTGVGDGNHSRSDSPYSVSGSSAASNDESPRVRSDSAQGVRVSSPSILRVPSPPLSPIQPAPRDTKSPRFRRVAPAKPACFASTATDDVS